MDQILAAAKQRRLEGAKAPLLARDSDDEDEKKKVSGAKRMQFGIFRKAAVLNDSDDPKKKPQSSDSDDPPPQKSKAKKAMDVDSEEEVVPKKRVHRKRPKKVDSDSEEDPKPRSKAKKASGGKKEESKEGWVLKKKRKSVFNQWDKRYLCLQGPLLHFYLDSTKSTLNKTLDLRTGIVSGVWFHYDENAPSASKKIGVKDKDETRFDIYVRNPVARQLMLKVEDQNIWQAEDWVKVLKEAIERYNEDE